MVFFFDRMVESFETVASSLVSGEDFTGFSFLEDQFTVSAAIVCDNQHSYM